MAVLTAVGVVLDASLGAVTEAAFIRAVKVDLEAAMASAVDGDVKAALERGSGYLESRLQEQSSCLRGVVSE